MILLRPNGDAMVAPDGSVVELSVLTAIALETVWVPGKSAPKIINGKVRGGRGSAAGPNGEGPDQGSWKLRLPAWRGTWSHLGEPGSIYTGPELSSSALDTNADCAAKWAFDRLDNEDKPPNRPAEMGKERHAELNNWLAFGTQPVTDGMSKLIPHFPRPGECESEVYFGLLFGRPGHEVILSGYIDVRQLPVRARVGSGSAIVDLANGMSLVSNVVGERRADYLEDGGREVVVDYDVVPSGPMHPVVQDLKTTGDFRWKKSAAQLRQNAQACIYALDAMLRSNDNKAVMKWTYAHIKEPGVLKRIETVNENDSSNDPAECTGFVLTKRQALATVARYVVQHGEQMLRDIEHAERVHAERNARGEKEPLSLAQSMPKNGESCQLYGGCPWKKNGVCELPKGGGGFMARRKQALAKKGVELPIVAADAPPVSSALSERFKNRRAAPPSKTTTTNVEKQERIVSDLGNRFGKTIDKKSSAPPSKPASALGARFPTKPPAPPAPAPSKPAVKPTPTAAKPATTTTPAAAKPAPRPVAPSKPLTGTTTQKAPPEEPEEPKKLEIKAEVDGGAAGGVDEDGGEPEGESLVQRLQRIAQSGGANANATAVRDALAGAKTHAVTATGTAMVTAATSSEENSKGALAVGINPPDVAPEWSDEDQDAEALRIAAGKGSASIQGGLPGLPASSPTAQAAAEKVATTQREAAEKAAQKIAEKNAKEQAKADEKAAKERAKAEKASKKKPGVDTSTIFTQAPSTTPQPATVTISGFGSDVTTLAAAAEVLDSMIASLMRSKQRRVVAELAKCAAALEALSAEGGAG